ncbi:DNA repair protein RAD50 [Emericellopsis cladophorae]|uniref:DNA repair protein RAD50 n=1 Tax=Emericellopsis cladophorae TaxID=2686198 RepID=A0A9Q0BFD0_9HYPO|nr:DNA repair protein RAD50 [Emericellopsis cladophorae]KAI6783337.1 DNA repair protein RAD50 [Emericellopsis cladophorae]
MSKIDKLSISGVRSFSPNVREAIQFYTPLTLIVGYNGSGKTTIIECLKYATTGELPPNSKGGAFIHDPKLCGEKEVMAQVKLQFRSINDKQHVATRSLQLTAKKTTRSQKTLDCSLVVMNNGERLTTSTRVAQLDELIPERLGVSPAILDAVIFCHQEESMWPLSEPAALKKRFDEIFEALKYTKAIENLKILRKKQVEQLGKLQSDEGHNKVNKDRGERAEKRMTGLQGEIEAAREKCEALTAEMEETQKKISEKQIQANSYLQIVQNLSNKKEQLEYRQDAVSELRQTIDELHDADSALEEQLSQYQARMDQCREEVDQNRAQYGELQKELATAQRDLNTKLSEQGKHQSDKDKYERQLKTRTEMVQQTAEKYSFRGFDGQLTDQQIAAFNERLQDLLSEKKRDLDRLQRANQGETDQFTAVITQLEGRKAARTQDRVSSKQRMGAIEKRIHVLSLEASRIDVDEVAKAILDGQLDEIGSRLQRAQSEFEQASWDGQLAEENNKLWSLENDSEKLGRELVESTRLASERAQLDFRKKELSDRKRKLETITKTWRSRLDAAVGGDWEPETLDGKFQIVSDRQSKQVEIARKTRETAREKLQKSDYSLKIAKEAAARNKAEGVQCQKRVLAAMEDALGDEQPDIDGYTKALETEEEAVETFKSDISLLENLIKFYEKCLKSLERSKKCHLCDRGFDAARERVEMQKLKEKIMKQTSPTAKEDAEKDLQQSEEALAKLRAVRTDYETYQRLKDELPKLQDECQKLQSDFDALERQLEDKDALVTTEDEKHSDISDLAKTVQSISQAFKDIKDSEAQVDRIQSQQASGGVTRSAEELHELQASVGEQLRVVKTRIAKLSADKQRGKDQISAWELERSELRNKISSASGQLEKKTSLQTQIQSLKEDNAQQRETIQRVDGELETIEPEITEAKAARDQAITRMRSKEQGIASERDEISNSIYEIKMVDNDIQDYVDRGGPSNLASNQRAIASLEKAINNTKKEVDDITKRANKLKEDLDSGDRKRKNINDNLNYRKHLRMLDALRQDIEELQDRNAHEDHDRLVGEARQLENHSNRLFAERGSVMGSMKTKDEELDRLLQEWEMDYKDAKSKYRESHIRVETTKAAIEDLAQCSSAVDKAVMQFHSMKMSEVNRIAGELWQKTYQGTDIDTILIRSDNESSTGKRSYNYRLCMVKQDTEMDMRGRCSAGQKVLASIIIRLALAESFGVNCGLIALDEPTTNLDRDNIKSLAESLHQLIQQRQAQSNFQLIVITHDEEFLRHMRCSDFCDSFFRVKRDGQQKSVISRESITKIF